MDDVTLSNQVRAPGLWELCLLGRGHCNDDNDKIQSPISTFDTKFYTNKKL